MDKRILLPLVILPAFQTGNMQAADQPAKRPNIILFMVDDMGWEDTSLPFWTEKTHYNEVYETPNMERLARQGVMFTQAYASSISSPSRCSLITGTNAARHRVTNWTLQKDKTTDRKDSLLDIPDWNYNGVSQVTGTNNTFVGTSFVQLLKNSGYHTIHCGKAHFGAIDTPGEDPPERRMSCCCCRVCSCRCAALCTCCLRGGAATAPAGCPCCWRLSSCCWPERYK